MARRLSRSELDHSLRDVFGVSGLATKVLPEDPFAPFDNDYTVQRGSGALIDSLELLRLAIG